VTGVAAPHPALKLYTFLLPPGSTTVVVEQAALALQLPPEVCQAIV
jgi:hypothetical protein